MKVVFAGAICAGALQAAPAQVRRGMPVQSWMPADVARDIFNAGQRLYDEDRFVEAESKFREVVRRFPANAIADRADYYLIRTLALNGKRPEALGRMAIFPKRYPNSKWLTDLQELKIQLTNEIPAKAETILLTNAPPAAPAPAPQRGPDRVYARVQLPAPPPTPPAAPVNPFGPFGPFNFDIQITEPQLSLQREVMRVIFRTDGERGIEIASERLKLNPSDPVVLSSLNLVAASHLAEAATMLLNIAKSSANPKARRDAIFWLGQSRPDSDGTVDTLVKLLPSLPEEDCEAVTFTLSQISTDKSLAALAGIARDRQKSEKVRNNALVWIAQSRAANRVGVLEEIYKDSMDNARIREQTLFALNQTRGPQAMSVIANIASSDPDSDLRRKAGMLLARFPRNK